MGKTKRANTVRPYGKHIAKNAAGASPRPTGNYIADKMTSAKLLFECFLLVLFFLMKEKYVASSHPLASNSEKGKGTVHDFAVEVAQDMGGTAEGLVIGGIGAVEVTAQGGDGRALQEGKEAFT